VCVEDNTNNVSVQRFKSFFHTSVWHFTFLIIVVCIQRFLHLHVGPMPNCRWTLGTAEFAEKKMLLGQPKKSVLAEVSVMSRHRLVQLTGFSGDAKWIGPRLRETPRPVAVVVGFKACSQHTNWTELQFGTRLEWLELQWHGFFA